MHDSNLSKTGLFLLKFYLMNMPTIMMPNGVFNKIRYAAVSAFWMMLNEELNRLNHLRRQLDSSILLDQCTRQLPLS